MASKSSSKTGSQPASTAPVVSGETSPKANKAKAKKGAAKKGRVKASSEKVGAKASPKAAGAKTSRARTSASKKVAKKAGSKTNQQRDAMKKGDAQRSATKKSAKKASATKKSAKKASAAKKTSAKRVVKKPATKQKAKKSAPEKKGANKAATQSKVKPTVSKKVAPKKASSKKKPAPATRPTPNRVAARKAAAPAKASKKATVERRVGNPKVVKGAPNPVANASEAHVADANKGSAKKRKAATKPPVATTPSVESSPGTPAAAVAGIAIGEPAPAFDLEDQSGNRVASADLTGHPYVVYFYPKDNTGGCTKEACEFRDRHPDFTGLGVRVLGVSADSVKSHAGFAGKYELPFTLLADPDKELINAYGTWVLKKNYGREYMGIERSTFLVDAAGSVAHAWRSVKVNGHAQAVLEEARKLG